MRTAYLGLGGNIGDPPRQMAEAVALLADHPDIVVEAVSSLYRTPPWGKLDQPDFLNAALRIATTLEAKHLLDICLSIEKKMMRERAERWGPRLIDIDILFIEDEEISDTDLTVPHLRLHERLFALLPMSEIAGDIALHGVALSEWISRLNAEGIKREETLDWWL